ncbi:hypothetical protein V6N11_031576 [Hibiscus sabdariffa]|uniref:Uncharacterized protein n=1 Tax=Hibiscus sabdariffa TaxID=183260 RepID=A0ABR2SY35_9ROSI
MVEEVLTRHLVALAAHAALESTTGESLDDFSEDEENIVSVTKDDDVHLLDADDVEAIMTDASEGNGLDVEDDVWSPTIARLGLGNNKPI